MSETETSQVEGAVRQAEYAFLVIKQKDGRLAIANVNNEETERQPSMEDVMTALTLLLKDLERQALAISVGSFLQQANNNGTSQSGLVVPEKRFVKRQKA